MGRRSERSMERRRQTDKIYRAAKPWMRFDIALRHRYRIGILEFLGMVVERKNRCDICKRKMGKGRTRHIDHDHVSGKIRGLLCNNCNMMLGAAKDDPRTLAAGITYLSSTLSSSSLDNSNM